MSVYRRPYFFRNVPRPAQPQALAAFTAPAATSRTIDVTQTLGALSQAATATGPGGVTWNPSDKNPQITLSNGNLTASLNSALTGGLTDVEARGTTGRIPGATAYYFEIAFGTLTTGAAHNSGLAISSGAQSLDVYPGSPNAVSWFANGYYEGPGGVTNTNGAFAFSSGDVLGFELLSTSAKIYKNGSLLFTFTNLPSGTPLYPVISLANNGDSGTVNFGASTMTYLPAGTQSWDGSQTGSSARNAVVAQTLGGLVQAATDTVLAQATIAQTLGALGQAATATVLDQAVVAQTLGGVVQAATDTVLAQASIAQTLGAVGQAATATSGVVIWNPADKDANITLSNNNLTGELTGAVTNRLVRATAARTTGYFEFTVVASLQPNGNDSGVGLANTTESTASWLGNDANGVGYFPDGGGKVYYNGGSVAGSLGIPVAGDIIGVELTSMPSIKFSLNGTLVYTYTGTMPSGDLFPAVSFGVQGDSGTANFGASVMSYLPAGVTSWDGTRTGSAGRTAVASQTLGALTQAATDTVLAQAAIAQTLGALGQAATATNLDHAVVAQTLGALAQAATGAVTVTGTVAQTLGAIGQAAADKVTVAIAVAQNLGALTQAAAATHPDTAAAAQTLGGIVQSATGGVIDNATAAQTLGALAQAATATASYNLTAAQTLGALGQTTAATHPVSLAASQTLGALAQAATDTVTDAGVVAQTLGALVQSASGSVISSATVAQTLGNLVQAATATVVSPSSLSATQTLGALSQALTGTVLDAATAIQNLGALGQSVAATHADTASVSQTLGAIIQATTGAVIDTAVVSQALGALNQTATAVTTSGFQAAQTLGTLVQALTGTAIDAATVSQALGGLAQTTTGGPVARIGAYADALGPLGQTTTGGPVARANVAQVLGALSQVATADLPAANAITAQILGALQQVASSTAPEQALAVQVLGALGQTVAAATGTGVSVDQTLPGIRQGPRFQATLWRINGSSGQRGVATGSIRPSAADPIAGSILSRTVINAASSNSYFLGDSLLLENGDPLLMENETEALLMESKKAIKIQGAMSRGEVDFAEIISGSSDGRHTIIGSAEGSMP